MGLSSWWISLATWPASRRSPYFGILSPDTTALNPILPAARCRSSTPAPARSHSRARPPSGTVALPIRLRATVPGCSTSARSRLRVPTRSWTSNVTSAPRDSTSVTMSIARYSSRQCARFSTSAPVMSRRRPSPPPAGWMARAISARCRTRTRVAITRRRMPPPSATCVAGGMTPATATSTRTGPPVMSSACCTPTQKIPPCGPTISIFPSPATACPICSMK